MKAEQVTRQNEVLYLRQQIKELKDLVLRAGLHNQLNLEELPQELSEDREVVLSKIEAALDAEEWYKLPQKWKDDAEIACIVLEKDRSSEITSPNDDVVVWIDDERKLQFYDLPYHLCMNKEVILHALRATNGPNFEDIPNNFYSDTDILTTAFFHRKLRFEDIHEDEKRSNREISLYAVRNGLIQADECRCFNIDFLRNAIQDGKLNWEQLPQTPRTDINFALSISSSSLSVRTPSGEHLSRQILRAFAAIRSDQSFWLKLLRSYDHERSKFLKELLVDFAPVEFFTDNAFMSDICVGCAEAFELIEGSWASDPHFLRSVLRKNPGVLKYVSHETQMFHPDLVIEAISNPRANCFAKEIYPPFWKDYEFIKTWVESGHDIPVGGRGLTISTVAGWFNDRYLCLTNAIRKKSLYMVGEKFLKDIPFMIEVLEECPGLYRRLKTRNAIANDPRIMTTVFAALPDLAAEEMKRLHFDGKDGDIRCYLSYLDENLNAYKAFTECILGNMLSTQSVDTTGTPLTLLNQGLETSDAYKRRKDSKREELINKKKRQKAGNRRDQTVNTKLCLYFKKCPSVV